MEPYTHGTITVRIEWPMISRRGPSTFQIQFSCDDFKDLMRSLPANREIPFCIEDMHEAVRMANGRRELIKYLSEELARNIAEKVRSFDTQNGYSPEEWKKINTTTPS